MKISGDHPLRLSGNCPRCGAMVVVPVMPVLTVDGRLGYAEMTSRYLLICKENERLREMLRHEDMEEMAQK